ncbi:MAG: FGGY family carbohydrate kinase [Microbacteriaceae bacterium]
MARTAAGVKATDALISRQELYALKGLQFLHFNTLCQVAADHISGTIHQADSLLMVPDLVNFWLTGSRFAEKTNASTTGLVNSFTGRWLVGRRLHRN